MTASNCGINNGADFEDEHVTIYIRLPCGRRDPVHKEFLRDEWFSISTQHMLSGKDNPICPVFVDPGDPVDYYLFCPPLSVGSHIFTFCGARTKNDPHSAYVFYLDTQNVKGGWTEAPPLPPGTFNYHLFEANDKIYGLGIFKGFSFDLLCLDCHDLSKGWQSIHPISNELSKQHLNERLHAFKLQYETPVDPATCKIKRRATHAMLFLSSCLISYDFNENAFKVYDDHVKRDYVWNCCVGVGHGDLVYFLCQKNTYEKPYSVLMVYNDSVHKWYPTPVVGLENFPHALPVSYERFSIPELPPGQLFLIGEGRLCIIWVDKTDIHNGVTPIYCTKFDIQVIDEQPRAVNVSTQLYTVRGPHFIGLDAVLIHSETMPQLPGRECTLAGGPSTPCQQHKSIEKISQLPGRECALAGGPSMPCKKHKSKGRKGKGAKSKAHKGKV